MKEMKLSHSVLRFSLFRILGIEIIETNEQCKDQLRKILYKEMFFAYRAKENSWWLPLLYRRI